MRRPALIFGMLLTLTTGVWTSALAVADWCSHEPSAPAAAPDEHDCCRARVGQTNAPHEETASNAEEATRENSLTQTQADGETSHAGMDCGEGAEESGRESTAQAALGERGLSCAECCAGRNGQTPTTAVFASPEQGKLKRAAGSDAARGSDLFAPATLDVSHLSPSQHAPPVPPKRRHILISLFLI